MTGQHSADIQLGYLLRAAESAAAAAGPFMHRDGTAGELAAKADHLAACVYAVDAMCRSGDLPAAWQGAEIKSAAREAG